MEMGKEQQVHQKGKHERLVSTPLQKLGEKCPILTFHSIWKEIGKIIADCGWHMIQNISCILI